MILDASMGNFTSFTRDFTLVYVKINSDLERKFHLKAPTEMGFTPCTVLRGVNPHYGVPESDLYWYLTYLNLHVHTINMQR